MEETILYCELMTAEQVSEFEDIMTKMGYDEMYRPTIWAERTPYWMREGRQRGKNEDPLAAVILTLHHESSQYSLCSAYRCTEGEQITPNMMTNIITALGYSRQH